MGEASSTERLIARLDEGDASAFAELLDQHRQRLRRMVCFRLDPRIAARVDASDVVQEAMAEAYHQLPRYLHEHPLPFYPWLRQIAWQKLVHLHQRHLYRQKRTVFRERDLDALFLGTAMQMSSIICF